jgi:hypothetical protein
MQRRQFYAGDTIFTEGDASDDAFIIRSGRVEISKASQGGPIRLAILGEDDVLGEMGLLDDRPRSASARALSDVSVEAISRSEFTHLLVNEPRRALNLLRALFERLRTVNQLLAQVSTAVSPLGALPNVLLIPDDDATARALPQAGLEVTRFPFRVGRKPENAEAQALSFNELEIADPPPYTLALNHFAIDLGRDGVVVRDRGSHSGTLVNGERLGVRAVRDSAPLRPGDNEIIAGPSDPRMFRRTAPYRFRVRLG